MALLRRQVDVFFRVEEGNAVHHDFSGVRRLNARDTAQRHGLAGTGGAEQREHFIFCGKADIQAECAQLLLNVNCDRHCLYPLPPALYLKAASGDEVHAEQNHKGDQQHDHHPHARRHVVSVLDHHGDAL